MKANEFVKRFGLFTAKEYLAGSTIFDNHLMVFTNDCELNRLVESHELVEKCGGLSSAKNLGGDDLYCFFKQPFIPTFSDIAQAILDVESCQ